MTKKEMKEIYHKAFDLLFEMQEEYYRHNKALINQDYVTAEDARTTKTKRNQAFNQKAKGKLTTQ